MKQMIRNISASIIALFLYSCTTDDVRNIAGTGTTPPTTPDVSEVNPVDITQDGFDFLEKMQGHWVGNNLVIADTYPWFAWDYRAISPSHIHGIHEGGTAGNLLTSFFVTDYKGKRTIMARNGGLLSGIYRTSYFVLDKVENRNNGKYYRLVDAIGGDAVMYMELRFPDNTDSLYFNSYTSNLGDRIPSRHMTFKGKRMHTELAQAAATATNFPQNVVTRDFSEGFRQEYLYVKEGLSEANSATFLAQQQANDVFALAVESGDPYIITDHPRLGYLQIDITRNSEIEDTTLLLFLSRDAFTDDNGFLTTNLATYDTALHFPVLAQGENQFLVTYLHPGEYYVTVVADKNGDGAISEGDITHAQQKITITPEGQHQITINNINIQN